MDPVLFLQVCVVNAYRKAHGLSVAEFNELDRECDVLGFIEIGYEPFHLTGMQGVVDEVEAYIRAGAGECRDV